VARPVRDRVRRAPRAGAHGRGVGRGDHAPRRLGRDRRSDRGTRRRAAEQRGTRGQLLATLAPAPAAPEEGARASLVVVEAEARAATARAALERARRLLADRAIAAQELELAEREAEVAEEAVAAARRAQRLFNSASTGRGPGTFRLTAPIAGTLTAVEAAPGASVSAGFGSIEVRNHNGTPVVATLSEPIFATLFAWILFEEVPDEATAIGGPILILGVVLAIRSEALKAGRRTT